MIDILKGLSATVNIAVTIIRELVLTSPLPFAAQ
jgi:hypothetical protein